MRRVCYSVAMSLDGSIADRILWTVSSDPPIPSLTVTPRRPLSILAYPSD